MGTHTDLTFDSAIEKRLASESTSLGPGFDVNYIYGSSNSLVPSDTNATSSHSINPAATSKAGKPSQGGNGEPEPGDYEQPWDDMHD